MKETDKGSTIDIKIWIANEEELIFLPNTVFHFHLCAEAKILKKRWFCQII